MSRAVVNALIERTSLGFEGHGLMTWYLHLKFPPGGQSIGGFCLGQFDKKLDRQIGTAWGMESITRIIETVGVSKWEDLPGRFVRVDGDWGNIYRIGHIVEDRWFNPDVDLAFLKGAK